MSLTEGESAGPSVQTATGKSPARDGEAAVCDLGGAGPEAASYKSGGNRFAALADDAFPPGLGAGELCPAGSKDEETPLAVQLAVDADVQVQLELVLSRRARRAAAAAAAVHIAVAAAARERGAVEQQAASRRLAKLKLEETQARMQHAAALAVLAGAEAEAAAPECVVALCAELLGNEFFRSGPPV